MNLRLESLLNLWIDPPDDRAEALAAFRCLYADPVPVNGMPLSAEDLVERARAIHRTYDNLTIDLVHRVETGDRAVIGFFMRGRHVGPLDTPLGTVQPTGEEVAIQVTDILTVREGLVTDVWMMASDLGLLMQLGAVRLA